ncbi:MAG: phenylalanine--tRNA ligase subunit alpha [Candidatus Diapherotrites archaeon]|nr:phenylalanine--tRNA ligase subunit alpha [Candidatus Diapherotrites archaeon]
METSRIAESLSGIERKTLAVLDTGAWLSPEEIAAKAGIPVDSARRAVQWLREKGLIELDEKKTENLHLSAMGKTSLRNGLPERLFVEALQALGGSASLEQLKKKSSLNSPELNVAMGIAKKNAWVSVRKEGEEIALEFTGLEKDLLEGKYALEAALKKIESKQKIAPEENAALQEAMKRGLAEKAVETGRRARLNASGEKALQAAGKVAERAYDIHAPVPRAFAGKKQPYMQFLNQVKRKLVALGFQEMPERLITQEFYNFDVLFQPQNHPARSWTDTYQLLQPRLGKLPDKKIVAKIKAAHENGGGTGSRGWGYAWSERIASRLMPNAHGTTADARQMVQGVTVPGKYFVVNRCYRPDIPDATHLVEFNQLDGFIVDKEINFRHLLGILAQVAVEFGGAEEVKFTPDYYPFTEPSVQLSAKHPLLGWIELAGAGVFRPEITQALGIKARAIAWGVGIDRLAAFRLGISDIRYLFAKDLNWLREAKSQAVD